MVLRLSNIKYRQKITLVILMFTVIPFLIFAAVFFIQIWDSKVEQISSSYKEQLKNSVENINNVYNIAFDRMHYINRNAYINSALGTDFENSIPDLVSFYTNIHSTFEALTADKQISSIFVYTFNKSMLSEQYFRSFEQYGLHIRNDKELEKNLMEAGNYEVIWKYMTLTAATSVADFNTIKNYMCLYKRVESLGKKLSIIEVRLDFNSIIDKLDLDIPKDSCLLYATKSKSAVIPIKNSISEEYVNDISRSLLKGKGYNNFLEIKEEVSINGDAVYLYIPDKYIFSQLRGFILQTVSVIIVLIVAIVLIVKIVSFYLTRRLSGLIVKMSKDIENVIEHDENTVFQNDDELGVISMNFNKLINKIRDFYQKVSSYETERKQTELEKKALELELMQSLINPHFLYNSLSVIRYACHDEKLVQLINSMITYYRIALNKGEIIIKVSQELEMIEEYLKTQKFAFISDFSYTIEVEDKVKELYIIKHLLQPIVENAFIHGVNSLEAGGSIKISGILMEGSIVFEVTDNGIGMDQDMVSGILTGYKNNVYGGYGLKNVRKRIEVYYGEGYGVDIYSTVNKGTKVTVTIASDIRNNNLLQ